MQVQFRLDKKRVVVQTKSSLLLTIFFVQHMNITVIYNKYGKYIQQIINNGLA